MYKVRVLLQNKVEFIFLDPATIRAISFIPSELQNHSFVKLQKDLWFEWNCFELKNEFEKKCHRNYIPDNMDQVHFCASE